MVAFKSYKRSKRLIWLPAFHSRGSCFHQSPRPAESIVQSHCKPYGTLVLYKIPGALAHWRSVCPQTLISPHGLISDQERGRLHHDLWVSTVIPYCLTILKALEFSPSKLIFLTRRSGFVHWSACRWATTRVLSMMPPPTCNNSLRLLRRLFLTNGIQKETHDSVHPPWTEKIATDTSFCRPPVHILTH